MSDYKTIECECGKVFVTKEMISKCPRCGKTHYSAAGGLVVILVVVVIAILIAIMFGAAAWVFYARSSKKSYWHYLGAIGLGGFAIYLGESSWRHDSSGWADTCLLSNGLAILAAIVFLILYYRSRNTAVEAQVVTGETSNGTTDDLTIASASSSEVETPNASAQESFGMSPQPATNSSGNATMKKLIIGSAIVIAVISAGLWYFLKSGSNEMQTSQPNGSVEQAGLNGQGVQTSDANVAAGAVNAGQPVTYTGAWFSVDYPSNFQARGSMRSSTSPDNFESATFTSPDNTVQFYVFSPQWRGDATDIAIAPGESMGSTKTDNTADGQIKWWTITANDGSYSRSYMERINSTQNTNLIFGIRYTSASALDSYRSLYEAFKASIKQFADGAEDSESGSSDASIAYIIDPPSNVRSCPNTSCDVVAECKTKNETVKIISVEGNWAMIETNSGARGYLHSSQYAQNTSGKVFTATVDKLRFRETPSFNGVVIREVSIGSTFTYLNEQTNMLETAKIAGQELPGYWYRVRAQDGREGWVHGCCISGI